MVRDVVSEGVPVEITDDWYAQDGKGNVWYLGEAVRNYENGSSQTGPVRSRRVWTERRPGS